MRRTSASLTFLALGAWAGACNLNPQPLPPGDFANVGASGGDAAPSARADDAASGPTIIPAADAGAGSASDSATGQFAGDDGSGAERGDSAPPLDATSSDAVSADSQTSEGGEASASAKPPSDARGPDSRPSGAQMLDATATGAEQGEGGADGAE